MALSEGLDIVLPETRLLKHKVTSITGGANTALISGVPSKRIKIWRMDVYAAAADKTCEFFSGTDSFTTLSSVKTLCHEKKSSDMIPVFSCNAGDDFKATPSDTTNWYFHHIYSVE